MTHKREGGEKQGEEKKERRAKGRERKMKEGFLFFSWIQCSALTPVLMSLLGAGKVLNSWSTRRYLQLMPLNLPRERSSEL